jgi:hypothetical protein
MKRLWVCACALCLVAGVAAAQYNMKRFKGENLNDGVIDSLNLTRRKICVTDFMGEINNNFTPQERKRGIRGPYYTKFNLRDSKLRCVVSKYDPKTFSRVSRIRKNDRMTVIGRIEQLAMGIQRFSRPYYVLRVSHVEPGWRLGEDEEIFSGFSRDTSYEDVSPRDVCARSDDYAEEYLRLKDRFSIASSFFSTFERDLNLDNKSALKFYMENCTWPFYMPNTDANKELLGRLTSGEPVTVCGRLTVSSIEDDALLLFSVSRVTPGW